MDKMTRAEMVKSMEMLVSSINCESYIEQWLAGGVADGDIKPETTTAEIIEYCDYYLEDATFKDLMDLFIKLMYKASLNGGLYCDGIVSVARETEWR